MKCTFKAATQTHVNTANYKTDGVVYSSWGETQSFLNLVHMAPESPFFRAAPFSASYLVPPALPPGSHGVSRNTRAHEGVGDVDGQCNCVISHRSVSEHSLVRVRAKWAWSWAVLPSPPSEQLLGPAAVTHGLPSGSG